MTEEQSDAMQTDIIPAADGQRLRASRVALVTGGARGLGAAIGRELARAGVYVVLADLDAPGVTARVRDLRGEGFAAAGLGLDVADAGQAAGALAQLKERLGRLDILVNNAGVDVTAPFDEIDAPAWDRVLDVNLRGPANVTRAALPHLTTGSTIINITSTAAKRAWRNASAYHASKWGLLGFSHALHAELRTRGIRVTAIVCGGMRTPFLTERFPDLDLGQLMDPSRVASAIRWIVDLPTDVAAAELILVPLTEASWP